MISPALNLIQTRPSDPAHSEYGGVTKLLHTLLMSAILTPQAQRLYGEELQRFPFPPGWGKLQSPLHHLGSYRLEEHARWSIIAPVLLRVWLRETHVQDHYIKGIRHVFKLPNTSNSPINTVVIAFAAIAKSNTLLMADDLTVQDRAEFAINVKLGHHLFQQLLEAAAVASTINPRSRSATPTRSKSVTPTRSLPQSQKPVQSVEPPVPTTAKAEEYRSDQRRPNVHVVMHYSELMNEYALTSNCNVLIGEDKHR